MFTWFRKYPDSAGRCALSVAVIVGAVSLRVAYDQGGLVFYAAVALALIGVALFMGATISNVAPDRMHKRNAAIAAEPMWAGALGTYADLAMIVVVTMTAMPGFWSIRDLGVAAAITVKVMVMTAPFAIPYCIWMARANRRAAAAWLARGRGEAGSAR